MKLIVPKHMFIHTTDSFVPIRDFIKSNYIVKGYDISYRDNYSTFAVNDISYSSIESKVIECEIPYEIPGFRIFHGIIYVQSDDASVLTTHQTYVPISELKPGISFVSIIKHIVVDIQVGKMSYTRQKEYVELNIYDLPSILLSYDEGGTVAMLLFNNKLVQRNH